MTLSVQILLPGSPGTIPGTHSSTTDQIYFKGYVRFSGLNEITVYIVKFIETIKLVIEESREEEDVIYGYVYKHGHVSNKKSLRKFNHFLILNQNKNPKIESLVISGKLINIKENYILMYYDFNKVLESEVEWEYCDNLYTLQLLVQNENNQTPIKTCNETRLECPSWLSSSMFIQHFINYLNIMKWLITTVKRDKKISIKQGNLMLAVLMDLILGCFALYYLTQDTTKLSSILMGILEKLINLLYSLLKWLMGAPAGLKLNNAFNKMLGKYFSYHVQLWWLFLDVSGEKLDTILQIYFYLGYLGFTFQAAAISDMISVATFHSYCIYVYAARMFHIQISGIIALLRFFVGRKYNPLRGSIDSCEYTNQELFVGTVAFTILLLLLPTTLMYYIVFTVFRVLSLLVQYTLAKLIYHVHTLPLYVSALWLMRSPKVAGNVLLEVDDRDKDSPLMIRLRLHNKSIFYLVSNFSPPVDVPKSLVWTNFFSNVFIGKQII